MTAIISCQPTRCRRAASSAMKTYMSPLVLIILLLISTLHRVHVEGTSNLALNPLSIGIRSAITRGGPLGFGVSSPSNNISQRQQTARIGKAGVVSQLKNIDDEYHLDNNLQRNNDEQSNNNNNNIADIVHRGGAAAHPDRRLHFWEAMLCGAISRSAAQTIMHPANTMKTILQSSRSIPGKAPLTVRSFTQWEHARHLSRGAGAQLILSIPHGAVNFAVLELVRRQMNNLVSQSRYAESINRNFGAGMDFISSAISTVCCSVVSTPQMMICDNIMAGTYPNLLAATKSLAKDKGVAGFYSGWWPGIAGKIPSYGLTWTLFEQIKRVRSRMFKRPAKDIENSLMGCLASATTVCIMIPMDTVKTRLVTQLNYPDLVPYKGINDCFKTVLKEEGIGAFYRGLTPRLLSVVPMIGIQFGVYEFMKKFMLARDDQISIEPARRRVSKAEMKELEEEAAAEKERQDRMGLEISMEVAADDDQPFPAPYPRKKDFWTKKKKVKS